MILSYEVVIGNPKLNKSFRIETDTYLREDEKIQVIKRIANSK